MRKPTIVLLCLVSLQYAKAQVSDSTVKIFSKDICKCIDTLDFNKPEAEVEKGFLTCKTISLTGLLNSQLVSPEILTDEKQLNDLDTRAFMRLANECDAINRLLAAMNKAPAFRETNGENVFTPAAFFKGYELKAGETNNRLHVYNSERTGDVKYQRLVDIRWTFETEEDALEWHRKKMRENSENGEPVKELILVEGAMALKVFREGSGAEKMLKDFGLKQRHHYFLFVYKNVACKVFIATDEKTGTKELVPFAAAAIDQLKLVLK